MRQTLTAMEAAAVLGLSARDRVIALAHILNLGVRDRGGQGEWRFDPDAVERLARTGLVKRRDPTRAYGSIHGR
jgi:hypothetical protein